MEANELREIIHKFQSIENKFDGVFSINTIPKFIKKHHFIISNTQTDSEPGQHWFCLLKLKINEFEFFDSLGVDNLKIETLQKYKVFKPNVVVKYNITPVQDSSSISCGLFVLYFLVNRLHNLDLSFNDLLDEIFEKNCLLNEELVQQFAKENF